MVHASLRAVGEVAGGPDQVHLALTDCLTPDGTLMMYAGCPRYYDEVGRGNLTPDEEREVLDKLPPFDPETARSARDHGALVELFRTSPGARVNRHVTRFVVWGKQAEYLISQQPWDYALGAGSALERFVELDGKILLLGCDHDTVTFLHYAEHIVDIPDKRIARYQVPIEENGRRLWRPQEEVDSSNGAHANWPDRFFAKMIDAVPGGTPSHVWSSGKCCELSHLGERLAGLCAAADAGGGRGHPCRRRPDGAIVVLEHPLGSGLPRVRRRPPPERPSPSPWP